MRWIFCLILGIFFNSACLYAEPDLVNIQVSSSPKETVSPKSFFTSVFTVTNSQKKIDIYSIDAKIPIGWQVISSLSEIELQPGESKDIPVTVFVPVNALAGMPYEIEFNATSINLPSIVATAKIEVQVLTHARIKITGPGRGIKLGQGQSASYNFTITNLGNGKDKFSITAVSAHGDNVELSDNIIELNAGEQKQIIAKIHIPLEVSPGTKHVFTVKATSELLEPGISSEAVTYTQITDKKPKIKGAYKTLSSQATTHLSGLGTGKQLGPQLEFGTNGFITDSYWLNFNYQGPYYTNRENYRGLSEERSAFEFGSKDWDVGMGDTNVSLSELTVSSLSEKGSRYRINTQPFTAMFFDVEKGQAGFTEDISGGKLAAKLGKNNEVGFNFYQSDESKSDASATRLAEKKRVASISGATRLDAVSFDTEYAQGEIDAGNGYNNGSAWWLNSRLRTQRFYADGEYIDAGRNYPGRRKDTKGHRAYFSYRIFKPEWVWVYNHEIVDNPKKDISRNTNENNRTEFGTSFNMKKIPSFSVSYQTSNSKSEKQTALSNTKENAIIFRSNKTFDRITASIDSKWSKTKDDVASTSTHSSEHTMRLNGKWHRFSPWVGYTYNTDKNVIESSEAITIRRELGILYQPNLKFYSSFNFSQEGTKGRRPKDALSFDFNFTPDEDTVFKIEGEMRDNNAEFRREWQMWFTFKRSFDMLFPVKISATAEGIIFIDANEDNKFEKGEQVVPGITLFIGDEKAITGKDGRYKFPSLPPGRAEVNMDTTTLPVGLASRVLFPYSADFMVSKDTELDIPLLKTAKVKGVVFEDINKNKSMDEEERGIPLIRVQIISDSVEHRETFTDTNGNYSFAGVVPGKYNVKIDTRWLPDRFVLTTDETYSFDLGQAEDKPDINFGAAEKERPILKTYTTQTAELSKPVEHSQK